MLRALLVRVDRVVLRRVPRPSPFAAPSSAFSVSRTRALRALPRRVVPFALRRVRLAPDALASYRLPRDEVLRAVRRVLDATLRSGRLPRDSVFLTARFALLSPRRALLRAFVVAIVPPCNLLEENDRHEYVVMKGKRPLGFLKTPRVSRPSRDFEELAQFFEAETGARVNGAEWFAKLFRDLAPRQSFKIRHL